MGADQTGPEWFSSDPSYSGVGVVELGSPKALLEGKATAQVDDRGLVRLSVEVERLNGAAPDFLTLNSLLTREVRVPDNGGFRTARHVSNRCVSLLLRCPDGLLRLVEPPPAFQMTTRLVTNGITDAKVSLDFTLRTADFSAAVDKPPAFWVLPLSNLVLRYGPGDDSAHLHPLFFEGAKHDGCITFIHREKLGFVAPLSGYRDTQQNLEDGRLRRAVTAIAVGPLDDELREAGEVAWLRLRHAFEVLGLCSLSAVGVPWTEIRASDGTLLHRLHVGAQVPAYAPANPPIDEFWTRATGALITAALSSEVVNRPFFWSALAKVVRSGEQDVVIEHRLQDVFIALDTLCDAYKTKTGPRLKTMLPGPAYKQVQEVVSRTTRELRALAESQLEGKSKDTLTALGNRIENSAFRTELGFVSALLRLLDDFGLADLAVIEQHFPTDGRSDQSPLKAWASLVSRYRSIVVHNGWFEHVAPDRMDHPDKVLTHLRDVLIRLLLTSVGYEAGYFPEMFVGEPPRTPSWVTRDTTLEDLGYFEGLEQPWPRPAPE